MSATIQQIIDDALSIVGEVTGSGVQQFSEDRMRLDVIRGFNLLFKKAAWRQYCKHRTITLDGSTGKATTSFASNILDFEDFLWIALPNSDNRISRLPAQTNPNTLGTGTSPLYWDALHVSDSAFAAKKILIYPITATGNIDIYAREYPKTVAESWVQADTMYLDRDMLAWAAAFFTLSSDGTNADAAKVCAGMLQDKYNVIMSSLASNRIPIQSTGRNNIPSAWSTV